MALYTRQQLETYIQEVDTAIREATNNRSYELDTGQGRQKVTRQDLKTLRQQREYWIAELEALLQNGLMRVRNCDYKNGYL